MRQVLVGTSLLVILITIIHIFWQEEYQYSLPTPIPDGYQAIPIGNTINMEAILPKLERGKPTHLLFFNPDCPCSRFTVSHIQYVRELYADKVNFAVVLPPHTPIETAHAYFGPETTCVTDTEEHIATACGIYATPQAVIIDHDSRLYYRGNYNKARFCTQAKTSFAQLAISSLLADMPAPQFGPLASVAYGCQLPQADSTDRYAGYSILPL